jgi:transposase
MKVIKEPAVKTGEIEERRKYDPVFKREAVTLWLSSGKSARVVSAELGIPRRHLYAWKKSYGPLPAASENEREAELAALRRENALLRQQRDILKKTLGIISEPQNNASNGSTP